MARERIIAIGLLTESDIQSLGSGFRRIWSVDDPGCFFRMLDAIDEADPTSWRDRDRKVFNQFTCIDVDRAVDLVGDRKAGA